ncbi:TLC domain-containing protein [Lipomyces oligophaga]|uniref:TLC domain-containing protein n=1 Tax=Lipomyces oligophaga TaxID=45792 RepID=UPI0034CEA3C8
MLPAAPSHAISAASNHKGTDPSQSALMLFFVRNQITLPIAIMSAVFAGPYLLPKQAEFFQRFYQLSYRVEQTGLYVKGTDDVYFCFFAVVVFTFVRAFAMDYVFTPFARWAGIRSQKGLARFAEQAWSWAYYCASFSLGLYIMYHSTYWLNLEELWIGWPHRESSYIFKWYYLVEIAFSFEQIFVLNIEARRKDHVQMFSHHIVTCLLLIGSYNYSFIRVGNIILSLMDFVDSLLSAAKMLKYLGYQKLCDFTFGVFIFSWIVCRHFLFVKVTISAIYDSHNLIGYKCFVNPIDQADSFSNPIVHVPSPNGTVSGMGDEQCFTERIHYFFISLLLVLQVLTVSWFYMIIKVAIKVVSGKGADDSRSGDEDSDFDDDDVELKNKTVEKKVVKEKKAEKEVREVMAETKNGISTKTGDSLTLEE